MAPEVLAQPTIAERLGYPADAKLLIIHADDLAVAHAQNQASFKALDAGYASSASVMVPCPWLGEVADYAAAHPNHDLGLHLTLTSEWKHYKWGPVAPASAVKGLVGPHGYFYDNCADVAANANPDEVETELRAQIERAKAMGIEPTHLDSHMGCLFFSSPEIFDVYLRLGREYGLPTLVGADMLEALPQASREKVTDNEIIVNQILGAGPADFRSGFPAYYEQLLRSLRPGLNELIVHLAFDDAEMQGVTFEHPDWGATWRQADFDFVSSESCRKAIEEAGIYLVSWREVGKLLKGRE